MALAERVSRIVLARCGDAFAARGFSSANGRLFKKLVTKSISHGVSLEVENHRTSASVQVALMIFHAGAAAVVDAGLKTTGLGSENYAAMPVDTWSIPSLVRRTGGRRASLLWGRPIFDEDAANAVADCVLEDFELVAEPYFSNGQSDSDLIAYFETDQSAGGIANKITLLSLYYALGQAEKLEKTLAAISASNSVPMTVKFRDYLRSRALRERSSHGPILDHEDDPS